MRKNIIIISAASLLLFSACQKDFLDLDPLDSITEAAYYKTPEHFRAASNDFYNKMISWKSVSGSNIYDFMDFGSDLTSYTQDYGRGAIAPSQTDVYWTNAYKYIRANNILLEKANEYTGEASDIAEYVAAAKFFRAYHHFFLLQRFGGVPIVTTVIDFDSPELYGARNSRYEVVDQILQDLTEAIEDLPLEQNIAASDKGHISKWAAEALKAKVLLYEATWEKYVSTSTDGNGSSEGAGTTAMNNHTIEDYLTEAIALTQDIMVNGGYELWNYNGVLNNQSMYYLFCLEDAESNPAGLDKSTNKEFILYSKYDFDLYQSGTNISHTVATRLAPDRKFMDMFLCTDGLPVTQSPLFQGYTNTPDEYQNRDYRLTSYFVNIETYQVPQNGEVVLAGPGGDSGSGYENRKFRAYNYGTYRSANTESQDYPHIRLAEVYLIYAEALFELNGSITDDQLNASINKVRNRAGLPPLTNAFVSNNGLDMLTEIRRERTVELYGENARFNDLKRWGIAEDALQEAICGSVVENTIYETNSALYNPAAYPYGEITKPTGAGNLNVLLLDPSSNRNFSRTHYLYPIPLEQIQLNDDLLQNPGY